MTVKLHRDNGVIEFKSGSIGSQTTRQAFLESSLGRDAEVAVDNEPFMTWRVRPEAGIAATVSFEKEQLRSVAWLFELPAETKRDWTERLELERKERHDAWLLDELGAPPYRFTWGTVSSDFDQKGCVSDIIVVYAI